MPKVFNENTGQYLTDTEIYMGYKVLYMYGYFIQSYRSFMGSILAAAPLTVSLF